MNGWYLFAHSVRLVFTNIGIAFRISAVLFTIQLVAGLYLQNEQQNFVPVEGASLNEPLVPYLIDLVCYLILGSWIAIAWHRYVLLDEVPTGFIPNWPGERILGYPLRLFLIVLVLLFGAGVALMIGEALTEVTGALGLPYAFLLFAAVIGITFFYRLSPLLPAYALGKPLGVNEAWFRTTEATNSLLVMSIISVSLSYGPFVILNLVGTVDPLSTAYLVITSFGTWVTTLVGVSLITTIYGHYVEGKPITSAEIR